jgi:hypothetical protein
MPYEDVDRNIDVVFDERCLVWTGCTNRRCFSEQFGTGAVVD